MRFSPALVALGCTVVLGADAAARPAVTPPAVTISAVGDIALAPSSAGPSAFFPPPIRRAIRADVALGNLEGTLATGGASKCAPDSTDCYAFRAPPSYSKTLRAAGLSVLNLANNHAFDFGRTGQSETLAALGAAGLRHTGRPGEIAVVRSGRVRIAFVGFAPYPWASDVRDIPSAVKLVREAARKADVVVATMHAGAEGAERAHVRPGTEWFLGENRGNAVAFSHAVVRAGADLVVGHGPHVLRGIEWYRGRLIAYSVGNFLGNGTLHTEGATALSAVLRVTLERDGSWAGGKLIPVRLTPGGLPQIDRSKASLRVVRDLSRADFGRNAVRVTPAAKLLPPAWRTG